MLPFLAALVISSKTNIPTDLNNRALEFKRQAINRDIDGLLALCANGVECIEVFRLTPKHLNYDQGTLFGVQMPKDAIGYQLKREFVDTRKPSDFHRKLLLAFCGLVKNSAAMPDFIRVDKDLGDGSTLIPFPGRGLTGKIASNSAWRVDFEQRQGKWVATKLIVAAR